ncbi:uncharacterized protein LOC130145461 [Falco biarmicus]|uniref:uncharacterized protein LOC130145461 n=1 Tax=Falco biarmicus TaxID=345155 RepID=UPI0024BC45B5|nr:uncharacterized protein LOC130145461 [Falco biarmicus]
MAGGTGGSAPAPGTGPRRRLRAPRGRWRGGRCPLSHRAVRETRSPGTGQGAARRVAPGGSSSGAFGASPGRVTSDGLGLGMASSGDPAGVGPTSGMCSPRVFDGVSEKRPPSAGCAELRRVCLGRQRSSGTRAALAGGCTGADAEERWRDACCTAQGCGRTAEPTVAQSAAGDCFQPPCPLLHFQPPCASSLPACCCASSLPALPASLPSSLAAFQPPCTSSLPACLPAFQPCCLPASLHFQPPCLPPCLPASLHFQPPCTSSLPACLPAFQPCCLPASLPASLPSSLPALPASQPCCCAQRSWNTLSPAACRCIS